MLLHPWTLSPSSAVAKSPLAIRGVDRSGEKTPEEMVPKITFSVNGKVGPSQFSNWSTNWVPEFKFGANLGGKFGASHIIEKCRDFPDRQACPLKVASWVCAVA